MADERTTPQLVTEALDDAKRLVQLEVAIAKKEATEEIVELRHAAISFAVGAVAALLGAAMLLVALVLAIAPTPITALVVGGVLLAGAAIAAFFGVHELPKKPLDRTRRRLHVDLKEVEDRA